MLIPDLAGHSTDITLPPADNMTQHTLFPMKESRTIYSEGVQLTARQVVLRGQPSHFYVNHVGYTLCRSQWPRGLRRSSAATRLLALWVRIPPGAWMFVSCECLMWSGRGLCDELITCPEESYRMWCVVVCDQETSRMRRPWPALGCCATGGGEKCTHYKNYSDILLLISFSTCDPRTSPK